MKLRWVALASQLLCLGMEHYRHLLDAWPEGEFGHTEKNVNAAPIRKRLRWERYAAWQELLAELRTLQARCPEQEWTKELSQLLGTHVKRYEQNCLNEEKQYRSCLNEELKISELRREIPKLQQSCQEQIPAQEQKRERNFRLDVQSFAVVQRSTLRDYSSVGASGNVLIADRLFESRQLSTQTALALSGESSKRSLLNADAKTNLTWSGEKLWVESEIQAKRNDAFLRSDESTTQSQSDLIAGLHLRFLNIARGPRLQYRSRWRWSNDELYSGHFDELVSQWPFEKGLSLWSAFEKFNKYDQALMPSWRSLGVGLELKGALSNGGEARTLLAAEERRLPGRFSRLYPRIEVDFHSYPLAGLSWLNESSASYFKAQQKFFIRAKETYLAASTFELSSLSFLEWQFYQKLRLGAEFRLSMLKHETDPAGHRKDYLWGLALKPSYELFKNFYVQGLLDWERLIVLNGNSDSRLWTDSKSGSRLKLLVGIKYEIF